MGNPIKQFREASGLTQEQLGDKIGVKKALISKWEKGKPPTPLKAIEIEEATGGAIPRWATRPDLWEAPNACST